MTRHCGLDKYFEEKSSLFLSFITCFRLETLAKENQAKLKNQEFFWLSKLEAIHTWLEDTIKEFEEEKEPTEETLTSDMQKIGVRASIFSVTYLIKFDYSSMLQVLKWYIFCGYLILNS